MHFVQQDNMPTAVEARFAKTVALGIIGQALVVPIVCHVELECLLQSLAQQVAPVVMLANIPP